MPAPILLHQRRLPDHLAPPPARAPETDADRRQRQLSLTRELTELNMLAARNAAAQITAQAIERAADPAAPDETPAAHNPTLALARATRAVISIIGLENRIAAGERAAIPAFEDPRGPALRKLLHPLTNAEPDPDRRRALRLRINERIDDALATDLDDDLPLAQIASVIAQEHGLYLDLTQVPDEYLDSPAESAAYPHPPDRPEAHSRDHR